jgi:hypothetical protein
MTHVPALLLLAVVLLTACGAPPNVVAPRVPAPPPWLRPADTDARVKALIDLPTITAHTEARYHTHVHLDVFYDGTPVRVPGGIGLGEKMAAIHTHDASGTVHIETTVPGNYTLGHFFELWGVPLENAEVHVDGVRVADAAAVTLIKRNEIAVVYGTPPAVVPARYVPPSIAPVMPEPTSPPRVGAATAPAPR